MDSTLALPSRHPATNHSLDEIHHMAVAVVKGGLFTGIRSPEAATCLMLICQSEGLHPIQAMKRYHIIQGRPTMKAEAMLAEFHRRGGKSRWIERTNERATIELAHASSGAQEFTWTLEDARRAGLSGKDVWKQYPRNMLSWRAISDGVRAMLPDCVVGIYTPEEAEVMPPTDAGIEDLQAARDARALEVGRAEIETTPMPDSALARALIADGAERIDGTVGASNPREVSEGGQTVVVYDVTLLRADGSSILVGTRKNDAFETARAACDTGDMVSAAVRRQANGFVKLLHIELADEMTLAAPGAPANEFEPA